MNLDKEKVTVFLFHGVVKESNDPFINYTKKHITVDRFNEVLDELKGGTCIPIDQIDNAPPYSYVITFDDGFENNYSMAAPILRQRNLPATFFITTSFIDNNSMAWTDELEHLLSQVKPDKELEDYLRYIFKRNISCGIDEVISDSYKYFKISPNYNKNSPMNKKMTWSQVIELSENKLFTIGGHGDYHYVYSNLTYVQKLQDIGNMMNKFSFHLGFLPKYFSYPEGLTWCYDGDIIKILKDNGIEMAFTAFGGKNDKYTNRFEKQREYVF